MDFFNFFRKPQPDGTINSIELVVKVTDYETFNKNFNITGVPVVQPHWEYLSKKGIIKINLGEEIVNYINQNKHDCTLESLFDVKENDEYLVTVDLELFKTFGQPFIIIDYRLDNKDYKNFYYTNQIIHHGDFTKKHFINETFLKGRSYLMMLNNNQYTNDITSYVKLFLNNKNKVTTEIILLNYPINISLNELILKVI
jgi:hypothetical protein